MTTTGIGVYHQYGKQSNYTTPLSAGQATRALGMDQKLTAFEINETLIKLRDLNTQLIQKYAHGRFKGKYSMDVALSNPWFNDLFLGNAQTTGAGPYTHTWDPSKTVNAITAELGIDTDTDQVIQIQRCTLLDLVISMAQDEAVRAKFNFQFGDTPATAGTSLDASVVVDDIQTPYTFASGFILENPAGSAVAEVQAAELSVNPNIKEVPEPNSPKAVNAAKAALDIFGKFTLTVKDNTWYNRVRARQEPTDNVLRFKFTNGLAGASERTLYYDITGLGLDQYSLPAIEVGELVVADIPFTGRTMQGKAINNTSTPP